MSVFHPLRTLSGDAATPVERPNWVVSRRSEGMSAIQERTIDYIARRRLRSPRRIATTIPIASGTAARSSCPAVTITTMPAPGPQGRGTVRIHTAQGNSAVAIIAKLARSGQPRTRNAIGKMT